MKRENPLSLWGFIGVGVVIVATLGFILTSLAQGISREPTPTPFPTIQMPTAALLPTATPFSPPDVPQVAPDFTLERADGSQFALAAQLAEGPVVLVFVRAVGG